MTQHKRASSSAQDLAVHIHLKKSEHSFEDSGLCVLARDDYLLKRVVKEAVHVKLKKILK